MSKHSEAVLLGNRPVAETDAESHAAAYAHLLEARIKHSSKQVDPDFADTTLGGAGEVDDEQAPLGVA